MSILLERLVKRYDGNPVVNDVSLEVADGEFFVLLGPSGSGKSTVLRMIAGLASIDSGRVVLRGRDVTGVPPQRRGVGFVFQHYALFRNMSVAENIEFALSVRRVPGPERRRRRDDLLEVVGLAGHGSRFPQQLSGGQQQRVALARALAHNPEVLLLDEPFGALDAVIRSELRRAVRAVQRELSITAIFVTHDQEEAFELADRVGIMNHGRLLEVGPPSDLYLQPRTEFAATFLGTANLVVGEPGEGEIRVGPIRFPFGEGGDAAEVPGRVQVLFRPEDVVVERPGAVATSAHALGEAVVEERGFAGSFERLRLRIPSLAGVRQIAPQDAFGETGLLVEALRPQGHARGFPLATGDTAWVGVRRVHTLTHPGLSFLILTDGSEPARAAVDLGGRVARLAHARVTLLAHSAPEERLAEEIRSARERIGSGLAGFETRTSQAGAPEAVAGDPAVEHFDLAVAGFSPDGGPEAVERLLRAGPYNLLLARTPCPVPSRVLICVAVGEPGKEDIRFAARLVRHLGAEATILTVLRAGHTPPEAASAERFLAAGTRSMARLGVPASPRVRAGMPIEQILAELSEGRHDLLVLGVPLAEQRRAAGLGRLVPALLAEPLACPVLIVRSNR